MTTGESEVTRIDRYSWVTADETEYRLTDLPTDPCHECEREIGDDEYCYFREGPRSNGRLDHVCWDCGRKVTGFGEPSGMT